MTLGNALEQNALRDAEATALISGDLRISYGELNRTSSDLAAWLLNQGLGKGDRVAIHWFNSTEVVTLLFACFKAGLIAVPINVRLKAPEVAYILTHCGAGICFSQPELSGITAEGIASTGASVRLETSLPHLDAPSRDLPAISDTDDALIIYTSGTTARPKGATHTHASLLFGARLMLSMIGDAGPVAMATTQMCHISGIVCMLVPCVLDGKTVVLQQVFHPATALNLIEKHRVTYTLGLPAMTSALIEEQTKSPREIGSLQAYVAGGDSVPLTIHERFQAMTGIPILELIGLTESCPVTFNTVNDHRPGSVGRAREGVDVKVVGADGEPAEIGEMIVRSGANFKAYWNDPQATSAALRNGWLYTGDMVRQDAGGYLWFNARLKQIIIRGGSNISPQEVEEAILQHPEVLEAGAIGLPDPALGQTVAAFVSLRAGASVSTEELRAFLQGRIADYKIPERIWVRQELPKGLTGKLDRRALTSIALADIESPSANAQTAGA